MIYYLFNRQELLQQAKDRYYNGGGKEKATKYYNDNKDVSKENAKNKYNNFSEEEKKVKRDYGRNRYRNMTKDEKTS